MKRLFRGALVVGITALLLVLFARGTDLGGVWRQIVGADLPLLLAALIAASSAYVLRAKRWQFLLRPVGPTRFSSALRATTMGFAASFVLPGRVGEVLRPYLLARRDGLSTMGAFATILVERVLDLIGVLILFAVVLLFASPQDAISNPSVFRTVQLGGLAAGAVSLVGFLLLVLVARHPKRAEQIINRLARALPRPLATKVAELAATFISGFAILRNPADAALALAGAFPLWCCSALSIWCVSEAFQLGVPPSGAFLMMMLIILGIAVPTPGGVGGVHYAFRFGATALYAAVDERAVGAAIVYHALTVLPVTIVGLIFAALEGLSMQRLRGLAENQDAKDASPLPQKLRTAENV